MLHARRSLRFTAGEDAASGNTCLLMVLNKFVMVQPVHVARNLLKDAVAALLGVC